MSKLFPKLKTQWWEYKEWSPEDIEKIDSYLMPVKAKVRITTDFYDNM